MSEAIVDLDEMPPGVYDVILYDARRERARLPKAFTVSALPLPASDVEFVGTFGNLTAERAAALKPGMEVANIGTITRVDDALPEATRVFAGPVFEILIANAVRVPVVLRAACSLKVPQGVPHCSIGDARVEPTSVILMTTPIGQLPFQIDQIRGLQPLERITVVFQVITRTEIVDQIGKGHADYGPFMNPLAAGAVVTDVRNRSRVGENTDRVDVALEVQAQRSSSSWTYASSPLRAGASLMFRTPKYEVSGTVIQIMPEWAPVDSKHPTTNGSGQ
jgi:hypothetical protein